MQKFLEEIQKGEEEEKEDVISADEWNAYKKIS